MNCLIHTKHANLQTDEHAQYKQSSSTTPARVDPMRNCEVRAVGGRTAEGAELRVRGTHIDCRPKAESHYAPVSFLASAPGVHCAQLQMYFHPTPADCPSSCTLAQAESHYAPV
ncbi:hypothetical protein J6590_022402 [Homalodisca vitripennis]|nr:hypothetical protein J6590_022402 [Homalodisca vitripennis]